MPARKMVLSVGLALLTLISTSGISGCSKKEPALAKPATDQNKPGKADDHAEHGGPTNGGAGEHAKHVEHQKGEHKRGEHTAEHKVHKEGGHHGQTLTAMIKVGDKVPDFAVGTLDSKTVKLSELQKDKTRTKEGVVVLSFWCTTCHSCRHVEPALSKLAKHYEGQAAVIALDANADETIQDVVAYVEKNRLALPIVLDPRGRTAELFGVERTTTTVVIDGNGVLRYCGQFNQKGGASAEDALKSVLAGREVAVKTTPHMG